jgi:hypothetical protein
MKEGDRGQKKDRTREASLESQHLAPFAEERL